VHSATEDKQVHFHQVHAKDGARVKQKRMCSKEGKAVPYKQVAKGYEIRAGEYVVLTQEEIDAAAGERSRVIELEEFVRGEEIDPVFYDRSYYLGAGEGGRDAYRLLHDALERSERVGIGRWVFHNREYLVAIRPLDRVLALHTVRFAAEQIDPGSLELPAPSRAPTRREIQMASTLVDSLYDRFDPRSFRDSYRDRVLALIEAKGRGEEPDLPEAAEPQEAPDLMAAHHFRQLHQKDGAPIDVQRWCSKEGVEIPYDEITHGYELEDGGQVLVSDLELEAIEPRKTRTIDVDQFVDLADVDPIYFDHPYFLVPASDDDGSIRAYRLLTEVMSRTNRAALGQFVMRGRSAWRSSGTGKTR
jgi:DNA end-binding protein Ku